MVDWSRGDAELFKDLFMLDGANKSALWRSVGRCTLPHIGMGML